LLRRHAADLLGQEEVQKLLDVLVRRAPKLVESLTPKPLSLVVIWQVLRNLLQEQIPIVDMRSICEALSVAAINTQDVDILTDKARESLGPLLIQGIYGKRTEIAVATLDPQLEQLLLRLAQNEAGAVLDPSLAGHIRQSINQVADKQSQIGEPVAMLVAPPLRRLIARMARSATKALPVLSYNELPDERQVRVIATVGGALEAGS
jgi:flagellar biosynthesis protein FlhA